MRIPTNSDVAVNHQEDGSLMFVALMNDGERMAELTISPSRTSYNLEIWNQEPMHGRIQSLFKAARGMKKDFPEELRDWLRDVLSWEEPDCEHQRHEKFIIDGRRFEVRFNVRTGAIRFIFPEIVIFSDRLRLADNFPEFYKMMNGKVESLLHRLVVESGAHEGLQVANDQMPTTVIFNEMNRNFVEGVEVITSYDPRNDVTFLKIGSQTVISHICLIEEDLPEWRYIAQGKFREKVLGTLAKNGVELDEVRNS